MNEAGLYRVGELLRASWMGNPTAEEVLKKIVLTGDEILRIDYLNRLVEPMSSEEYRKLEEEYSELEEKRKTLQKENERLRKEILNNPKSRIERIIHEKEGTIIDEIRQALESKD